MTRTTTRTEYAAMGVSKDGKLHMVHGNLHPAKSKKAAEERLAEHKRNVERYPKLYTAYSEYKILTRTVEITTSEWEEA